MTLSAISATSSRRGLGRWLTRTHTLGDEATTLGLVGRAPFDGLDGWERRGGALAGCAAIGRDALFRGRCQLLGLNVSSAPRRVGRHRDGRPDWRAPLAMEVAMAGRTPDMEQVAREWLEYSAELVGNADPSLSVEDIKLRPTSTGVLVKHGRTTIGRLHLAAGMLTLDDQRLRRTVTDMLEDAGERVLHPIGGWGSTPEHEAFLRIYPSAKAWGIALGFIPTGPVTRDAKSRTTSKTPARRPTSPSRAPLTSRSGRRSTPASRRLVAVSASSSSPQTRPSCPRSTASRRWLRPWLSSSRSTRRPMSMLTTPP